MNKHILETVIGLSVIVVAALFFSYAVSKADMQTVRGYQITAQFDTLEGLREGGDVLLSGVKVGSVVNVTLNQPAPGRPYVAVATLSIDDRYRLPVDSSAELASDGLLGDRFLRLLPGRASTFLEPGAEMTQIATRPTLGDILGPALAGMLSAPGDDIARQETYEISAGFNNVDGVSKGTDVRLNGVRIGAVSSVKLVPYVDEFGTAYEGDYTAQVSMSILKSYKIPTDSAAAIASEGLLGGRFIRIELGAEEAFLAEDDEILFTSEAMSLEQLIGQLIYSQGQD